MVLGIFEGASQLYQIIVKRPEKRTEKRLENTLENSPEKSLKRTENYNRLDEPVRMRHLTAEPAFTKKSQTASKIFFTKAKKEGGTSKL